MQIYKIRVNNFKSFYTEETIDFTQLNGLWKISGQIGSGKTTIGEAIIYGLYGSVNGKNNKDLISWGQKHATVEIWCNCRNRNIYIHREINSYGQSPMSVEVDGEPIVFTDKRDAQAQLEKEYLDSPRSVMELLCVISFNSFKSLSTLNTKDTKLFLDRVLGFDMLTSYVDLCKDEQSCIRTNQNIIKATKIAAENQLTRLQNFDPIEGDINEVRKLIEQYNQEIVSYANKSNEQLRELKLELNDLTKKQTSVTTLGKAKKKEIDLIKSGTCPTCGAPIDQSHLEEKEKERQAFADLYKQYNARISEINEDIQAIDSEMTKYVTEKKSLVKSQENRLIKLEEQLRRAALDTAEIDRLKSEIEECEKNLTKSNEEMEQYNQLIDIFTVQIRQKVLESFIPTINARIKELAGMLNMPYIPEYDSMFKCTVKTAGLQQIPTSSLSVGQLKMVDMTIILAILSSVIAKISSNVIFLDELFSNLDPRTRADMITVLRTCFPKDTSVLIVSHQDIDNELFDGHIRMRLNQVDGVKQTAISIEQN